MSDDKLTPVEIELAREKLELERERLSLERERLSAIKRTRPLLTGFVETGQGQLGISLTAAIILALLCLGVGVLAGSYLEAKRISLNREQRRETLLRTLAGGSTTNAVDAAALQKLLPGVKSEQRDGSVFLFMD